LSIIGLMAVLYSGLWLVLAYWLHDYAREELHLLGKQGLSIDCENLRKSGYPLRIGLTCDALRWQDAASGYGLTTGKIVVGAPLYAPTWQSVELKAPAYFDLAPMGRIEALWQRFALSSSFADETGHDLAVTLENLHLTLAEDQRSASTLLMEADFAHLQIKQQQEQIKATLSFDALRLPEDSGFLPTITGEISLQLDPTAAPSAASPLLPASLSDLLRGRAGQLERLSLRFSSGGGLIMEGTFHISLDRTVSGQLTAHLLDTGALLRTLQTYLPTQASNLESLFFALNAMPKDSEGNPLITITIDQGQLRLGFIPLGKLPIF